jgi:hypothetical protein
VLRTRRRETRVHRITRRRKYGYRFGAEELVIFLARTPPAHQVNCGMVSQADEECPLIPRLPEQFRLAGQPNENLLKQIARIVLVAGEIQEEREQPIGVFVVDSLKFQPSRHSVT